MTKKTTSYKFYSPSFVPECSGSSPTIADWNEAKRVASENAINSVKQMDGMEALLYNFGKDYRKAKECVSFQRFSLMLITPSGTISAAIDGVQVKKKSWRERHFGKDRKIGEVVAHIRAQRVKDGVVYELNYWRVFNGFSSVAEYIDTCVPELCLLAQRIYNHGGAPVNKC